MPSILPPTFYNYENRALTPASFRPKPKTANCDELAVNASRPICIVGVGVSCVSCAVQGYNIRVRSLK